MELGGGDEARETLAQLEQRLRRDVEDMVKVLRADVPVQLTRGVRQAFERSAQSDAMNDAAVAALKKDTTETGARVATEVGEALASLDVWLDVDPLPEQPDGLDAHPVVGPVLAKVGEELAALLGRHSVPSGDHTYRLPSYFVAGHFMKSLVANYWQALRDFRTLKASIQEEDQSETREARRKRWDSA